MAFEKPVRSPFVMYSCVENDFMIQKSTQDGLVRTDTRGNNYTREQYEEKLPLMYMRQLMISGTMPDTINGVFMDAREINDERSTFRLRTRDLFTPDPGLYPMFESQSGRANLEMPDDYFRITWRMEFVDANTNKILEEKSRMFSAVLYNRGFDFPAKSINGIPTTRKSIDEGYLVIDSEDQLFHVKMIKGKPFVEKVEIPEGLKFKHISCVDFRNKRYYAYLFSEENDLYILTQDDYVLKKLPVDGLIPEEQEIKIYADYFHYNIISDGEGYMRSQILDADFNPVDEYSETWPVKMERTEGKIYKFLFPGELSLSNSNSNYNAFFLNLNKSINWLVLSLILIVIQFFIIKRRNEKFKNQIVDFTAILFTGIFGFLAVNIFPNKFFK
ncbi:MAG: DUF4857 domain-containing protein [Prolixibacteraceae bacterium]|nr:DUF4857 domain-containing protein [Prolixibacteraceae bacterium]